MAITRLSLEAPDVLTPCILRLVDTSTYNEDLPAKCAQLQITPPGFSNSFFVDNVYPEYMLNLTACDIKIQKDNCGTVFNDLPDGVYVIRYSVSPNDTVFVEYNHLRITKALIKLKNAYCDLDIGACGVSDKFKKNFDILGDLYNYLYAAKAKVEFCREAKQGMDIYKFVLEELKKVTCKNC